MGQYHLTVNLDKKEYLDPHALGCGLKLFEQVANNPGVGAALVVLLAASNGRGGGDFAPDKVVGRWAGDKIAIVGDYAELGDLPKKYKADTIYEACGVTYRDISPLVAPIIEGALGGKYKGDGWKDWKYDDRPTR